VKKRTASFGLSLFGAAFATALLSGCPAPSENGAGNKTSSNAMTNESQGTFKVALLTPGDVNDGGWNQLGYEGLQAVEKELSAKTSHQVTKNREDFKPAFNDLGDQKYNVVFCYGFEYGKDAKEIAPQFPDTKFIVVSGDVQEKPNLASLELHLEDATYLLGMAAGGMTKTNVLGCIGGQKFPAVADAFTSFEKGAKAVNPKVIVKTVYLNSWEDQSKGKEAANSLLAQKADFLIHNADQAGKGMFDAVKNRKGVMVFGTNRDQNNIAPLQCLGSAVIEMPRAFVEVSKSAKDGNFQPVMQKLTMQNNTINAHWNRQLKAKIPATLMKKIEAAEKKIKDGQLKVGA
jgi:basic membrane lipoprotein Med (substrate-binding protein (PBP1-ABC) superfamily)